MDPLEIARIFDIERGLNPHANQYELGTYSEDSDNSMNNCSDSEDDMPTLTSSDEEPIQHSSDEELVMDQVPSLERSLSNDSFVEPGSKIAKSEYKCGICYELMVMPTTLDCGHSLCRPCLASWVLSSNSHDCPECRQPWTGHPKVNILLRSTMEKFFAEELKTRNQLIQEDAVIQAKLIKFNEKLSRDSETTHNQFGGLGFLKGVLFSFGLGAIVWLAWYWNMENHTQLVQSPVIKWSVDDVQIWLKELGPWTDQSRILFQRTQTDGRILVAVTERELEIVYNITDELHQRAFMLNLKAAQENGAKPPADMWEFKTVNPGLALLLLFGIKDVPRTTFLLLFFWLYSDLFLPFLHVTCPTLDMENIGLYITQFPDPTISQWLQFIPKMSIAPYLMVFKFTRYIEGWHSFSVYLIFINCIALTIVEVDSMYRTFREGPRGFWDSFWSHLKKLMGCGVLVLVWPIVPGFICDIIFYAVFYLSPLVNLDSAWKALPQITTTRT